MITESQIKSAIKRIAAGEKTRVDLKDEGERGAGRLSLICRKMIWRVSSEFYAIYYRDGKRTLSKIGSYPTTSLAEARKKFREEYAPAISAGAEPSSVIQRRRHRKQHGTVRELFTAYVESLKAGHKRSAYIVERILLTSDDAVVDAIGGDLAPSEIEPRAIVAHLAEIHGRGTPVMAAHVRAYVCAAFSFGLKAENDYTRKSAGATWGIKINPVSAIPTDPDACRPGERFLSPAELGKFWLWLVDRDTVSRLSPALRLIMATGQRVEEILRISETVYEKPRAMLFWARTKNGRPHAIPVPPQAVDILDRLHPNKHGIYFAHQFDPTRPSGSPGLGELIDRFREDHPEIPAFTARDARRTWKTLAGDAGLTKEERDRIQNHLKGDISIRHYDRYDYLVEKRAAMAKWSAYLDLVIIGQIKEIGQRESNVVPIGQGAAARGEYGDLK